MIPTTSTHVSAMGCHAMRLGRLPGETEGQRVATVTGESTHIIMIAIAIGADPAELEPDDPRQIRG